jgi:small ligand-binding sensory domain FIST
MRCASVLSTVRNSDAALRDVVERLAAQLGDRSGPADLAVIFASMHHADLLGKASAELTAKGFGRHVIGCTGETIVGEAREVEGEPALAVWMIDAPGLEVRPVRLVDEGDRLEPIRAVRAGCETLLLLGDPFSFAPDPWLKAVDAELPGLKVVGGMASGSHVPRQNRLVLDGVVHEDGAVGVLLGGPVSVRMIVSQGCRPIGRPLIVTRAERNVIRDLGRRPALEVLREIFEELPPDDQERVQSGLHIGRVINEYQETFRRGDFLVRNVMGADDDGGIAITDVVRVGQTIQFHVRDAETADEDLRRLVETELQDRPAARAGGALLFSCNGRGTRLFDEPDHDVGVLRELLGPIPVAGFFAMGELGPVGGQNFVHGYTASVILFEQAETTSA